LHVLPVLGLLWLRRVGRRAALAGQVATPAGQATTPAAEPVAPVSDDLGV
jgi:hypothetical protein